MLLLAVNSGSSTLKFRLYDMPSEKVITKGSFERIGSNDSDYTIRVNDEKIYKKEKIDNHEKAVNILLTELVEKGIVKKLDDIKAVGHRVVHGGVLYSHSVVINDRVLEEIERIKDLAPLHKLFIKLLRKKNSYTQYLMNGMLNMMLESMDSMGFLINI